MENSPFYKGNMMDSFPLINNVGHEHFNLEDGMRLILKVLPIAFVFIALIAAGCAVAPQSHGTVADAKLQSDVMRMIGIYESAAGGDAHPKLLSANTVGKEGSSYVEHWNIDSNGKKVTYEVKLAPSPRGGVDYGIVRLGAQ